MKFLGLFRVPSPFLFIERHGLVARVLIDNTVPDGVEVTHFRAFIQGHLLQVPTLVASWKPVVYLGNTVERLVDISKVVDHKSQGEGALVFLASEVLGNFLDVF